MSEEEKDKKEYEILKQINDRLRDFNKQDNKTRDDEDGR